jgi:hypothetical protein
MSNLRVVAWLAWLTVWTWLTQNTAEPKEQGEKGVTS